MKKILVLVLLVTAVAMLSGCTYKYTLKENWIDEDDVQYALQHPDVKNWIAGFGTPVVTEYRQDTVVFIYNYRPHLYKTSKDGEEYKPNNWDRVPVWGQRTEFIEMQILNNQLVGIKGNQTYKSDADVHKASKSYIGIVIATVLGIGGIVTAIVLTN